MKQFLAVLMLSAMVFSSCGDEQPVTDHEISTTEDTVEMTAPGTEPQILMVEDATEIDGVVAVTKIEEYCTYTESAYRVDFEIDGLKRYAEIALPNDYAEKTYPTVLYFPDVGYEVNYLIENFAKRDVIVIRMFQRGSKANEGTKDFCGEDFADAEKLLDLCIRCEFLSRGGVFTAGAVTGATFALKLAAEHPDVIAGCVVVDAICDYESYAEERGEQIKALFLAMIGCSEDRLPAELAKRSPKTFCDTIKAPVLLFCYEESPSVSKSQSENLKALLDSNGNGTEIQYLNPVSSDFNGTAFMKMIPWINSISKNLK